MSIPETSFHAETGKAWTSLPSFCFIRMARERQLVICSPPRNGDSIRSPLWLRPKSSVASTEAPDFSSSATTSARPFTAASCSGVRPRGGGHEARPTGSRRERTRAGKLASCANCASLKSHSPTQTLHAMTKECQEKHKGEEGAVANEETVTRGWEGLCPSELRNPFSSCCGC